jgi:hypothetical protein
MRMKFDSATANAVLEKLGGPDFTGPNCEGRIADFVSAEWERMGWKVERREVEGSRFPQRAGPWIGWLGYGLLTTAFYCMFQLGHPAIGLLLGFIPVAFAYHWLSLVLQNRVRFGSRFAPTTKAPVVIARPPQNSAAPVRIVFQAVLGGLETDFFPILGLSRGFAMIILHICLTFTVLLAWAGKLGPHPSLTASLQYAAAAFLTLSWFGIVSILVWEVRQSRSIDDRQWADRRGLAVLLEMARSWPANRSSRIEAIFIAAGGQALDYAGSREVNRLLRSDWLQKPSLLLLFFAPGAAAIHRVLSILCHPPSLMEMPKEAAQSLWVPIHRSDPWTYLQLWPFERRFAIEMNTRHADVFVLMGGDSMPSSDVPVEPKVLEQTSQLATEIALRWAKEQSAQFGAPDASSPIAEPSNERGQ